MFKNLTKQHSNKRVQNRLICKRFNITKIESCDNSNRLKVNKLHMSVTLYINNIYKYVQFNSLAHLQQFDILQIIYL